MSLWVGVQAPIQEAPTATALAGIFFAVVLGVGLGHFVFFRKPTREMANLLLSSSDGCGCAMA